MKIKLDGIDYTVTQKVITMAGAALLLERPPMRASLIAEGLRATMDDCFDDIYMYQKMIDEKLH